MSLNQDQNGGMEKDQLPETTNAQTTSVDESRRRFTKSGLAASGVLLTMTSRPVLGGGTNRPPTKTGEKCCRAPSAWMSGDKSVHGPEPVCDGKSPTWWKNCSPNKWPVSASDKFPKHFSCGANAKSYDFPLIQVCDNNFARFIPLAELCSRLVAAYLNCKSGRTPFLKEETVRAMFVECTTKGTFSPTAGVEWSVSECVEYLTATQMDT